MTGNEQGEERKDTIGNSSQVLNDVPGYLPEYMAISRPHTVTLDRNSDGEIITISSSLIDGAYNEITTWRKNTFLVPYGKIGRDFIDQLRTVPTIVIAHTFCASPDTRISYRRCLLIQGYFCTV